MPKGKAAAETGDSPMSRMNRSHSMYAKDNHGVLAFSEDVRREQIARAQWEAQHGNRWMPNRPRTTCAPPSTDPLFVPQHSKSSPLGQQLAETRSSLGSLKGANERPSFAPAASWRDLPRPDTTWRGFTRASETWSETVGSFAPAFDPYSTFTYNVNRTVASRGSLEPVHRWGQMRADDSPQQQSGSCSALPPMLAASAGISASQQEAPLPSWWRLNDRPYASFIRTTHQIL
jgi:hypothetical protein